MKKNIWDKCKDCIIDIPETLYHDENLLEKMLESIPFEEKDIFSRMKSSFPSLSSVCIKKDTEKLIGQEYYFIPQVKPISDVATKLWYPVPKNIEQLNFSEYSFDYHDENWELNLFDATTAAYFLKWEEIFMKNIYFWFQHHEKQKALEQMKKSVFPFSNNELLEILSWTKYQREDGNILLGRKKHAESVFFSRINFLGFLKFVQQFWWDIYIWDFLTTHAAHFKYYLFDINIQYIYKDWKLFIEKTSIYGLL